MKGLRSDATVCARSAHVPLLLRAEESPDAEHQGSGKACLGKSSVEVPALWQDKDIEMQSKPQADGPATNRNKNGGARENFCRAEFKDLHIQTTYYGGEPASEKCQETVS